MCTVAVLAPTLGAHHLLGGTGETYPPSVSSHAVGGVLGGAFLGTLYRTSPRGAVPGALMFCALAVVTGLVEEEWAGVRERERSRRLAEVLDVEERRLKTVHYDPSWNRS